MEAASIVRRLTALSIVLSLAFTLAACGGSSEDSPPIEPTPAPPAPAAEAASSGGAAAPEPVDLVEHLRKKTFDLWETYNTHDADALKVFYSDDYWLEREEDIRSELQPFDRFGITIEAEETSAPMELEPGKWETRHVGSFPLGSVNMVFIYEEFNGEWLLTYAEDQ